jgi:phosphoribosyl 1,2-cyclic phosphate phosphodiesterase
MMRVTLLGTGSSTGSPQLLCDCPVCRSEDPRNRRTRFAILVETDATILLIDTPFEIKQQLLAAGVKRLDALWLTHTHSDHLAGIDDLRIFSFRNKAPLPLYALPSVIATARDRFKYLFDENEYSDINFLEPRPVTGDAPIACGDLALTSLYHRHGKSAVVSFRSGPFAFLADISEIAPAELEKLRGLDTLVISCTVKHDHYKHMKLDDILALIQRIAPRRAILTHMNHRFDHEELLRTLPAGVEPGYDGMVVEL